MTAVTIRMLGAEPTLFAVLVGGMRALTRTVAEQAAAAAREAAKEATDALYEKLRTNDFRHVEISSLRGGRSGRLGGLQRERSPSG